MDQEMDILKDQAVQARKEKGVIDDSKFYNRDFARWRVML